MRAAAARAASRRDQLDDGVGPRDRRRRDVHDVHHDHDVHDTTTTTTTTTTIAQPPTTVADGTGLYSPTPVDGWGIARNAVNDQYIDAVEIAGGACSSGGRFDQAKRNSQTATRANLMAVELSSGALLPFVADTNGTVNAIASNGSSLYIGGTFTTVNGVARNRLAKLDLATGAVDTSFTAGVGNIVHDMVVVGSRLYIVGEFNTVNGVERHRAAAVNTSNGELDATFDPNSSSKVQAIAASPNGATIYLGGNFASMGGVARANLAAVDGVTGALKSPAFKQVNDLVEDLAVSPDGSHLYAGTRFNSAVDWDTANGDREWLTRADGDMQAVVYSNHMVYGGFHDGFESNISLRLLALDPDDGVPDATFRPASNGLPRRLLPRRQRGLPRSRWLLLDDGRCGSGGPGHLPQGMMTMNETSTR